MVMPKLLRMAIFIWSLVLIFLVLKYDVSESKWLTAKKQIAQQKESYSEEINAQEVDNFLIACTEFEKLGISDYINSSNHPPSLPQLDWKAQIWLVYHHWDTDRFFYVSRRIKEILQEIEVRHLAENLIAKLKNTPDIPGAREMIDLQNKILQQQKYTSSELLIIESRQNKLKKFLSY